MFPEINKNYKEKKVMAIKNIISDMDGVIYRGKSVVPGAKDFINRLISSGTPFLFLTNNSEQTPLDLKRKLEIMGFEGIDESNFITSAMATADFLHEQQPAGTAYVIGGGGLINELYKAGFSITENNPDYVVVGKTKSFNFDMLRKAISLIMGGAKFIGTNPDVIDPMEDGFEPACGSILASIEIATGKKPYIIGKPNSLMMTIALKQLGAIGSETLMIGDRMDTDIVAGMEAGMKTCLVLSGVSHKDTSTMFPYKPDYIFDSIKEIELDQLD
ncbi:N-acetylglucosamine-6-phosphate deacetylase (NagD) [Chitinispirillum alkaliphilum]|nr:N-acetylglucosamine-6-phosphate deacetylase (NagD) [Chitinispirillum alkaliphilum]